MGRSGRAGEARTGSALCPGTVSGVDCAESFGFSYRDIKSFVLHLSAASVDLYFERGFRILWINCA